MDTPVVVKSGRLAHSRHWNTRKLFLEAQLNTGNVGKSSPSIGRRLESDRLSWMSKEGAGECYKRAVDARFGEKPKRPPVGKSNAAKFFASSWIGQMGVISECLES